MNNFIRKNITSDIYGFRYDISQVFVVVNSFYQFPIKV